MYDEMEDSLIGRSMRHPLGDGLMARVLDGDRSGRLVGKPTRATSLFLGLTETRVGKLVDHLQESENDLDDIDDARPDVDSHEDFVVRHWASEKPMLH